MSMVLSSPPMEDGPLPSLKFEGPGRTVDGSSSARRGPLTVARDFIESVPERFHESVRQSETLDDGPSSLAQVESDWRFAAQGTVLADSHGPSSTRDQRCACFEIGRPTDCEAPCQGRSSSRALRCCSSRRRPRCRAVWPPPSSDSP